MKYYLHRLDPKTYARYYSISIDGVTHAAVILGDKWCRIPDPVGAYPVWPTEIVLVASFEAPTLEHAISLANVYIGMLS